MFWTMIRFDSEEKRRQFHAEYMPIYMGVENRNCVDLFTLYESVSGPAHVVYLPPYAAALVREELSAYALQPCDAPADDDVCLMIGDTLAASPSWFDLDENERQTIRDGCVLSPKEAVAQAAEFDDEWLPFEEWSDGTANAPDPMRRAVGAN
jgi:hypothetical protein